MKRLLLFTALSLVFGQAFASAPELSVMNQILDNDSVTIGHAQLAQPGSLVIYAISRDGDPLRSAPLGRVHLASGDHRNVVIRLDQKALVKNGYTSTTFDGSNLKTAFVQLMPDQGASAAGTIFRPFNLLDPRESGD